MASKNKLAIFDIDGTIAAQGSIPRTVIAGMKHIQEHGYLTTVSSGRGAPARVPWISLLASEMATSNGIYPVYLYYKRHRMGV